MTELHTPTDPLLEQARALLSVVEPRVKTGERARKLIADVTKVVEHGQIAALRQALVGLEKLPHGDMQDLGLLQSVKLLCEGLQQRLLGLRDRALGQVLRELTVNAAQAGMRVERIGDLPPTVALAPFTVTFDIEAGLATLAYAREDVAVVPLEARAILAQREISAREIRESALPSATFFSVLRKAYRAAIVARELKPGERVDLVDLLVPLSCFAVDADRWRKIDVRKLPAFPRYMLAYQLHRLRRESLLEHDGWRIELGTATGGAARNKLNVVWLPVSPTDGQYYLSIRFVPR